MYIHWQIYCRSALANGCDCCLKDQALAALPLQWFNKWIFLFQRYSGKQMYRGGNRQGRRETQRRFVDGQIYCRSALANGRIAAYKDTALAAFVAVVRYVDIPFSEI